MSTVFYICKVIRNARNQIFKVILVGKKKKKVIAGLKKVTCFLPTGLVWNEKEKFRCLWEMNLLSDTVHIYVTGSSTSKTL